MRSFLILLLVTAAVGATPAALADDTCDATGSVCATNDSYGEPSDCDTYGNAGDERGVAVSALDASAFVGVYDECRNYGGGPRSEVGAYYVIDTAATGYADGGTEWGGTSEYCYVYSWVELEVVHTFFYNEFSCPASPPSMPLRGLGVLP